MAYAVSANFKTAIKDQTTLKSCLILFGDLFFDSSDFTDSGVVFNQYFNTSDDLTFGDCPSDTLSFSVVANGALAGYGFGKCRAYLGVQTDSQPYAFGSINAHIEVGGYTWTASGTGLYCDGSLIDNGEYVSLISDGTYVYAVGLSSSYKAKIDGSEGATWTPNRFMAQKLRGGLSAVFSANTAYVWDGTNVITYEYVPMGVYLVEKPRSTVGDTVVVQDAYDQMKLFDADASQFLGGLTYPITLSGIYTALCDFVGVSYASSTFTYSTTSYASSPFSDTSCSLRDILWWIAERSRTVAHFNRVGELALMVIGTTEETLTASDIGQDGYSIAEYLTPAVTGVLLKGTNGSSLTFGTMDTPYVISANPFVSTISNSDLNAYWAIPRYVPMELNVLEADPSVDIGDLISVKPMVDEIILLANVYDEIYVNNSQEAYSLNAPEYSIPLMERTVTFIGAIRAKYVATGNEVRDADISDTEYNANVAVNMANDYTDALDTSLNQQSVFNRLTNNGTAQGIFLDSNGDLYVNGTYIQAHTVAVDKLTGTIHDSGNTWSIDFTTGTITIGTLNADNINGGTLSGSQINIGSNAFKVDSSGNVTITKGSITIGSTFSVTSAGKLTSTSAEIGGWTVDSTHLYKTSSVTAHQFTSVDSARMWATVNGQLDEATVLAQYPYYDLDGDGHITAFDCRLAMCMMLGIIPNGTITSSTAQLNSGRPYGSLTSLYATGQGFIGGAFGVFGTTVLGNDAVFGMTTSSDKKVAIFGSSGNIQLSDSGNNNSLELSYTNGITFNNGGTFTYFKPVVVSTW